MKRFEDVWEDIQATLKTRRQIPTICRGIVNDVLEVDPNAITVRSRAFTHKERIIFRKDFEYAWKILSTGSLRSLEDLPALIGKRAITCAILAKLRYVKGECNKGKISLSLRTANAE